jgi:hypothetical protein
MTRRLRIAGTAFGALLVPACAGFQPDATVMHPAVSAQPPAVTPPMAPLLGQTQGAKPRVVEKFAEGRSDASAVSVDRPKPPAPPSPTGVSLPPPSALEQTKLETKVEAPALPDPPRVAPSTLDHDVIKPAPEPVPDAEGVIRPNWPTIKGLPTEPPTRDEPKLTLPTPGELPPSTTRPVVPPAGTAPVAAPGNAPAIIAPPPAAPPALPPGVIGSSIHKTNASPVSEISVAEAVAAVDPPPAPLASEKPVAVGPESPIVRAVRAFQENKPDEAVACLKDYDPATQQILLSLLPALGRLGEGHLQQMKPQEMDVLLEQLTKVPNMLRPRASLMANNVRLCREVHNFAHVEPFPDRHSFRPDDIVYLYMELANFTCAPDQGGGYTITLASSLELKDASGNVVWRAEPKDVPDKVSSPPQDYYRNFRLSVPNVPAGTYTLAIKTTDRPTGRAVEKSVELRVGVR